MIAFHELINQSLPGTMVQHLYSLNGGEGWLAGLAVREDSATLARLPKRVDIHSRGALIQVEHVHLILLMLQIQGGLIYETFVSIQHEDSPEFIARMAAQEAFSILMFDGVGVQPVRAFITPNGFQRLFERIQQEVPRWPAWEFQEFDAAKESLYARYPSVEAVWQALGRRLGGIDWISSYPSAN